MTGPEPADVPALADLLPHAAPAILLDRVLAWRPDALVARVDIVRDTAWRRDEGVPAHVAIEYMAQACAAFVGMEGRQSGRPPRVGLLLGTRDFRSSRDWFREGEALDVESILVFRDSQMGVFDCRVRAAGQEVCRAQLTVIQPDDPGALLGAAGGMDA